MRLHLTAALLSCVFSAASLAAADSPDPLSTYVLGPDDQLVIRVLDLDEVEWQAHPRRYARQHPRPPSRPRPRLRPHH